MIAQGLDERLELRLVVGLAPRTFLGRCARRVAPGSLRRACKHPFREMRLLEPTFFPVNAYQPAGKEDELTYVEGPIVEAESLHQLRLDLERAAARMLPHELQEQRSDVFPAVAQRRQHHRESIEPGMEIGAKLPGSDGISQRFLRGG